MVTVLVKCVEFKVTDELEAITDPEPWASWETDKLVMEANPSGLSEEVDEKDINPDLELESEFAETLTKIAVSPETPDVGETVIHDAFELAVQVDPDGQVTVALELLAAYPKDKLDGITLTPGTIIISAPSWVTVVVHEAVLPLAEAVTEIVYVFEDLLPDVAVMAPVDELNVHPVGKVELNV